MKYTEVSKLSKGKFKRIVGTKKQIFELMMKILSFAYSVKRKLSGKPDQVTLEDKLLMALNYWRQYLTHAHIGVTYGYSESQTWRTEGCKSETPKFLSLINLNFTTYPE